MTILALASLWLAGVGGGSAADAPTAPTKPTEPPTAATDETVVLDETTMWRFFRVRDAAHVRHTNGVLARAALSWSGHEWPPTAWNASDTSPVPPADWAGPGFDDSVWPRERLPQPFPPAWNVWNQSGNTGSINLFDTVAVLLRAKFTVKDPT